MSKIETRWVCIAMESTLFFVDFSHKEQLFEKFKNGSTEKLEIEGVSGHEIILDMTRVEAIYTSTPEERRLAFLQEKAGRDEKKEVLGPDWNVDSDDD